MSGVSRRGVVRTGVGALAGVFGGGLLGGCASTSNAGGSAAAAPPPTPAGPPAPWQIPFSGRIRELRYSGGTLLVRTMSAGVKALDAASGRERWHAACNGNQPMAVVGGVLYTCADGVVAFDLASGRQTATIETPAHAVLNGVFGVLDGVLYATAYSQSAARREVWAIDVASRKVRWQVQCPDNNTLMYVPAAGTLVYSHGPDGSGLTALDTTKNGATVWTTSVDLGSVTSTAVDCGFVGGVILAAPGGGVVAGLDPLTRETFWTTTVPTSEPSRYVEIHADGGDAYYVWTGTGVAAFPAGAGAAPTWTTPIEGSGFALNSTAVFDTKSIFLVGDALYAIDRKTGNVAWRHASDPSGPAADMKLAAGGGHCFAQIGRSIVAIVAPV